MPVPKKSHKDWLQWLAALVAGAVIGYFFGFTSVRLSNENIFYDLLPFYLCGTSMLGSGSFSRLWDRFSGGDAYRFFPEKKFKSTRVSVVISNVFSMVGMGFITYVLLKKFLG